MAKDIIFKHMLIFITNLILHSRCGEDDVEILRLRFSDGLEGEYDKYGAGKDFGKGNDLSIFEKSEGLKPLLFLGSKGRAENMVILDMITKNAFDTVVNILENKLERIEDFGYEKLVDVVFGIDFLNINAEYEKEVYKGIARKSFCGKYSKYIFKTVRKHVIRNSVANRLFLNLLRGYGSIHGMNVAIKRDDGGNIVMLSDAQWTIEYTDDMYYDGNLKIDIDVLKWLNRCGKEGCAVKLGIGRWKVLSWMFRHINVSSLDISYNRINTEDIKKIGKITSLEKLCMCDCQLERGSLEPIKQLKLRELDISENKDLDTDDMKTIGEIESLEKLNMGCCDLEEGALEYIEGFHMKELNIFGNENLDIEDFAAIGNMGSMEVLDMQFCKLEGRLLEPIGKLKGLKKLNVSENYKLGIGNTEVIGKIISLEKLYMVNCKLGMGSLVYIKKLKLKELYVSSNYNFCVEDIEAIGEMKSLELLNMSDCYLKESSLKPIGKLRGLKELDVSSNHNFGVEDIKVIGQIISLEILNMRDCYLKEVLLNPIEKLKRLKKLYISSKRYYVNRENIEEIRKSLPNLVLHFC